MAEALFQAGPFSQPEALPTDENGARNFERKLGSY
jgi:hypothetical protein